MTDPNTPSSNQPDQSFEESQRLAELELRIGELAMPDADPSNWDANHSNIEKGLIEDAEDAQILAEEENERWERARHEANRIYPEDLEE